MGIVSYINTMNRLYGSEQQVASLPYGSSQTYGAPEQIDMPNIQDLIREEGVQVGQQVKEGGRIYDTRKYFKPGGLVEPGVMHYAKTTPLYQKTTEYKKRKEAAEKGLVYDRETDTFREDIRKRRLVLKTIVPPERYKQIKSANPGMSEIELQKAYEKLTRNQQDGLVYTKRGVYPNRSGVINPSPAKLQELRHASKLPKSFKIIQDAKIKNPKTQKLWTFDEWKNASQTKRTYYLGLAKDYEGFRAKQKKWQKITQEQIGPRGYESVPGAFRGDKNGLLRWLRLAAEKENPNYKVWYKDGKAAGVYDKKADTVWRTHTTTTEFPNKKHKSIHKHKDFNKVHGKNGFFEMAKKFKYSAPDTVLGRYFVEYGKVPSYSEIYNFLTRPNSKATAKGYNALHKHHTSLVSGLPSRNIQLTLWDRNLNAENLMKRFNTLNDPNYKNMEWMDKELKKLNIRMKVGNKMLGVGETTIPTQLSKMKEATTKLFKERFKENPKLAEDLMKHLNIAKTAKGPAKFKAMQFVIGTIGTAAAASLFDKFGIDSAMADTGAKSSGVTTGDFFLAGAAPLATKKGRSLYGKAAKAALKSAGTIPGLLAIEAGIGPGIVASTGGTFGEAIASPLLLEGTIRDKRIYDELKKQGYSEDQIQVVKDSVMLRADTGNVGLESSMIPLQEIEHEGKTYTAGDPKLSNIASLYDEAAKVIAKEDEERLKKAKEFDYLQDTGFNTGGRVPFGKGKLVDIGRRKFMQWLLGAAGATVAAGTGLIKWGKVAGKGKTIIKAGDHIIQGTPGMPDWFIPLVNRITKEGTDVSKKLGTVEREIVHTKKINQFDEVTVYQDMNTGNVRVEYGSHIFNKEGKVIRPSNDLSTVHLEYKAPDVIESGKYKGQKTKSEFSAAESEPNYTRTGPDDADLTFEGINEVNKVEDLTTDVSPLKQFGTKKKLTHKDKVVAKKKQKYRQQLEEDTSTQADYIETKYGPGPEPDTSIDEFGNVIDEYGEIIE